MDGKILIFLRDYQLKRQVMNLVAQLELSFVECNDMDELSFKTQLIVSDNKLMIYEFSEGVDEEKQFQRMKSLREKGWKILVVYSKYSIPYIDKSQAIGINDLIIHPVEILSVKNKILTLLSVPIEVQYEQKPVTEPEAVLTEDVVKLEINRAERGKYVLSFVLFELASVVLSKQKVFVDRLKDRLRETDAIIRGREKNTYLVMCPFTPKNFVVEVENKIRVLFEEMKNEGEVAPLSRVYLYGLTLGEDGEYFEVLLNKLENNLHESKIVDQAIKHNILYDPEKLKAYRNMYRR